MVQNICIYPNFTQTCHKAYFCLSLMKALSEPPLLVIDALPPRPTTTPVNTALLPPEN